MKNRYLYTLIFCIPALLVALITSFLFFGGVLGILWIYVFGDDTWPQGIDIFLIIPFILVFAGIWITLLTVAFKVGKAHEADINSSPKRAVSAAFGATALFLLFIALHQWQVGNIGPTSVNVACSDFCTNEGYKTSMIPARNTNNDSDASCNCLGAKGQIEITTPMTTLRAKGY